MTPETPVSDRALLLDALDWLTKPHRVPIILEGNQRVKTVHPTHDGLIKQLRVAIASSLGGTGGGKAARERIPLDADALTKYDQIEAAILQRFAALNIGVPHLLPEDNLRAWYVVFIRDATEVEVTTEYKTLTDWKKVIEEKLSPPTVRELAGEECPECGAAWYTTVLNAAVTDGRNPKHRDLKHRTDPDWFWVDEERKPALTITYRDDERKGLSESFAKCGHCGTVWMGAAGIRALAFVLERKENDTPTITTTA